MRIIIYGTNRMNRGELFEKIKLFRFKWLYSEDCFWWWWRFRLYFCDDVLVCFIFIYYILKLRSLVLTQQNQHHGSKTSRPQEYKNLKISKLNKLQTSMKGLTSCREIYNLIKYVEKKSYGCLVACFPIKRSAVRILVTLISIQEGKVHYKIIRKTSRYNANG